MKNCPTSTNAQYHSCYLDRLFVVLLLGVNLLPEEADLLVQGLVPVLQLGELVVLGTLKVQLDHVQLLHQVDGAVLLSESDKKNKKTY